MMSSEAIKDLSQEAATRAAAEDKVPFIVWPEDPAMFRREQRIPFPNLGDHRPEGWTLVHSHFVDKSGFGEDDIMVFPPIGVWFLVLTQD